MRKYLIAFNLWMISSLVLLAPNFVSADAWWGEGYRSEDWVLQHGGALIRYQIYGKKDPSKYKVRMYLMGDSGASGSAADNAERGNLIETETGNDSVFDDAINNKYKLRVFYKNKSMISTDVVARPGEIMKVYFDLEEDFTRQERIIAYPKHKIELTPESSKYINQSRLMLRASVEDKGSEEKSSEEKKTGDKEKEEVDESDKPNPVRGNKPETDKIQRSISNIENKVELLKSDLNQAKQSARKRNVFTEFLFGPDKKAINEYEKQLNKLKNNISELNALEQQPGAKKGDIRSRINTTKLSLIDLAERKEKTLNKMKNDLNLYFQLALLTNKIILPFH